MGNIVLKPFDNVNANIVMTKTGQLLDMNMGLSYSAAIDWRCPKGHVIYGMNGYYGNFIHKISQIFTIPMYYIDTDNLTKEAVMMRHNVDIGGIGYAGDVYHFFQYTLPPGYYFCGIVVNHSNILEHIELHSMNMFTGVGMTNQLGLLYLGPPEYEHKSFGQLIYNDYGVNPNVPLFGTGPVDTYMGLPVPKPSKPIMINGFRFRNLLDVAGNPIVVGGIETIYYKEVSPEEMFKKWTQIKSPSADLIKSCCAGKLDDEMGTCGMLKELDCSNVGVTCLDRRVMYTSAQIDTLRLNGSIFEPGCDMAGNPIISGPLVSPDDSASSPPVSNPSPPDSNSSLPDIVPSPPVSAPTPSIPISAPPVSAPTPTIPVPETQPPIYVPNLPSAPLPIDVQPNPPASIDNPIEQPIDTPSIPVPETSNPPIYIPDPPIYVPEQPSTPDYIPDPPNDIDLGGIPDSNDPAMNTSPNVSDKTPDPKRGSQVLYTNQNITTLTLEESIEKMMNSTVLEGIPDLYLLILIILLFIVIAYAFNRFNKKSASATIQDV